MLPTHSYPRRARSRAGVTLVELVLVVFVMTIAMGMYSGSVTTLTRQRLAMQETSVANQAVVDLLETMRHEDFATLYVRYNSDPFDDPDGLGSAPGWRFRVPGLTSGDPDVGEWVGSVLLPGVEAEPGRLVLREDADQPDWGLPRDLDGDSVVDDQDHRLDYRILPVRVRVEWRGRGGERALELCTMLTRIERE